MKSIWHYALDLAETQTISMPAGARILCAANREGHVALYAEVDSAARREARTFWVIGTGNKMPDVPLRYIGTVSQPPFWWHVHEEA